MHILINSVVIVLNPRCEFLSDAYGYYTFIIQGTQGDIPMSLSATGGHISASFQTLHGYSNDEQWNSDLDDNTESDFAGMLPHLYTNKEFTPTSRQNEKRLLDEATEGTPAAK